MSEEIKSTTKQCEELYPETTSEFKKILKEQYDLFCRKQLNYGPDNISVGTRCEKPEEIKLECGCCYHIECLSAILRDFLDLTGSLFGSRIQCGQCGAEITDSDIMLFYNPNAEKIPELQWGQTKYRPLRMSATGSTQTLRLNP